jgi:uncharacterized protein YcbK (DUF882 family)
MVKSFLGAGHRLTLKKRFTKLAGAVALTGVFAVGGWAIADAGGETRSISLYHMHTGESLTITYKVDGRYVPSAMKQINYLLRDWRRNQTITIDPKTIDLVWELHEDLGSKEAIHIVCGYRSAQTNAFLHRIGRHVAKESQHILGRAIDFYFPDVPTLKIRNSALVRQVGGVGYYRSAGGPTGFLHVDSGHVRHWGPYISPNQMASIMRENMKTVGRRLKNGSSWGNGETQVASNTPKSSGGILAALGFGKKGAPAQQVAMADKSQNAAEAAYAADGGDMADLSADAAAAPAKIKAAAPSVDSEQQATLGDLAQDAAAPAKTTAKQPSPLAEVADPAQAPDLRRGAPIPKPRLKPVEVMLMAAANIKADQKLIRITAASAPPPSQNGHDQPSPVADSLGTVMAAAADDPSLDPSKVKAANGKASVVHDLKNGTANDLPTIKPMIASAGGSDINWWPLLSLNPNAAIRRDGMPSLIGSPDDASSQHSADGKQDLQTSVIEGKGNLDVAPNKHSAIDSNQGVVASN